MLMKTSAPGRPRTSIPLAGTVHETKTALSFESDLALSYAKRWLTIKGSPTPSNSAVIRRALHLYAAHLSQPDLDAKDEVRSVERASSAHIPDKDDQEAATARLEVTPLPEFSAVLRGLDWREQFEALNAQAEAHALRALRIKPPTQKEPH